MTMQTQLRKISATVRDGNDAEEFSYKALDFAHYVKTDPALKEGVDAMVAFARQASDIKAQGTYRRLRRGGEKRKPLTQDAACAWMLNEYEAVPGTRVRTSPVEKAQELTKKMSKDELVAFMAQLQAQLAGEAGEPDEQDEEEKEGAGA